jgi:hypothetical protein
MRNFGFRSAMEDQVSTHFFRWLRRNARPRYAANVSLFGELTLEESGGPRESPTHTMASYRFPSTTFHTVIVEAGLRPIHAAHSGSTEPTTNS